MHWDYFWWLVHQARGDTREYMIIAAVTLLVSFTFRPPAQKLKRYGFGWICLFLPMAAGGIMLLVAARYAKIFGDHPWAVMAIIGLFLIQFIMFVSLLYLFRDVRRFVIPLLIMQAYVCYPFAFVSWLAVSDTWFSPYP